MAETTPIPPPPEAATSAPTLADLESLLEPSPPAKTSKWEPWKQRGVSAGKAIGRAGKAAERVITSPAAKKAVRVGGELLKTAGKKGEMAKVLLKAYGADVARFVTKKGLEKLRESTLGRAVVNGVSEWVKNQNPLTLLQREKSWYAGAAFGLVESGALLMFGGSPADKWIKGGLNFALINGAYLGTRIYYEKKMQAHLKPLEAAVKAGTMTADEKKLQVETLEKAHALAATRIKNFALGVSTANTYTSVGGIIGQLTGFDAGKLAGAALEKAKHVGGALGQKSGEAAGSLGEKAAGAMPKLPSIDLPDPDNEWKAGYGVMGGGEKPLPGSITPEPKLAGPAGVAAPEPQGTIQPAGIVATGAEPQANLPRNIVRGALHIGDPDKYQDKVAGAVGEKLQTSNQVVDQVIRQSGLDPHQLSAASYEKVRMAVQHKMEDQANASFDRAAASLTQNNTLNLDQAAFRGREIFLADLGQEATKQQMAEVAKKALEEQMNAELVIKKGVNAVLNSELAQNHLKEVTIKPGGTVAQMLAENGYPVTSTIQDAPILGAHIAANYDLLNETWGNMAKVNNWPLEQAFFFPSMGELAVIVEKAQGGDQQALKQLQEMLHWIPSNKQFRILNKESLAKAMELLKQYRQNAT